MSNEEKIQHKQTYVEYLKQLTSGLEKEIWDLQHLQVDPYAELKAAHAAGKRIAIFDRFDNKNEWALQYEDIKWLLSVDQYKIVEDDEEATKYFYFNDSVPHLVKVTKCALTGKIRAEVVE